MSEHGCPGRGVEESWVCWPTNNQQHRRPAFARKLKPAPVRGSSFGCRHRDHLPLYSREHRRSWSSRHGPPERRRSAVRVTAGPWALLASAAGVLAATTHHLPFRPACRPGRRATGAARRWRRRRQKGQARGRGRFTEAGISAPAARWRSDRAAAGDASVAGVRATRPSCQVPLGAWRGLRELEAFKRYMAQLDFGLVRCAASLTTGTAASAVVYGGSGTRQVRDGAASDTGTEGSRMSAPGETTPPRRSLTIGGLSSSSSKL